jgi:glycerate-2-kinase
VINNERFTPIIAQPEAMRRVKATGAKASSRILRLVKGVTTDDLILVLCPRGNAILIRRLAVCMLIGDS